MKSNSFWNFFQNSHILQTILPNLTFTVYTFIFTSGIFRELALIDNALLSSKQKQDMSTQHPLYRRTSLFTVLLFAVLTIYNQLTYNLTLVYVVKLDLLFEVLLFTLKQFSKVTPTNSEGNLYLICVPHL